MLKKIILPVGVVIFAFVILSASILVSSSVSYRFTSPVIPSPQPNTKNFEVNYILPFTGSVLPDSPLWPLKATRDRIWYAITSSPLPTPSIIRAR